MLNTVIIALNALALGSHASAPTATSSPCVSPPSVSALQSSVLRSVSVRVRAFAADVRRRGPDASVSAGLCDSLFRRLLALLSFTSPVSISAHPSLVVTVDPSGWEAGGAAATLSPPLDHLIHSSDFFSSYLRADSALRERAVPIVAHRIALPSESLRPVDLVSALPPDLAALYAAPSARLLLDAPRPLKRPRRPHVFGSHAEYVRLVLRLLAIGMVTLTTAPLCINGLFATPKDANEDRLILDGVFANALFAKPDKARLPDPSVLARIVVPAGSRLHVAKSDLSNYYHHLALPAWLRPYFCLVGVPAADLGLPGAGLVYPMCCTVPMGWSHSVVVAQAAHEHSLYSAGALRREHSLLARLAASPDGAIALSAADDTAHGIYIDDFFTVSLREERANAELDAALSAYSARGFVAKLSKVLRATAAGATVLGLLIDGTRLTVSVAEADRVALLRTVLRLLSQPTVSGNELASVVGSLTWCMLVRRPALQCLHRAYRFALVRGARPSQLWPSVVRELLLAASLLPLLSASLCAPLADRLVATDACDFGGAVVARPLPLPAPLPAALTDGGWTTIIQHRWRWSGEHINALELRAILLGLLWPVSCRVLDCRVPLLRPGFSPPV